jgi:hypothetical protein
MIISAERRFPVRIRIGVPPGGFGQRYPSHPRRSSRQAKRSDAWLLDPTDRLAARLARDGESEAIHIEETDTTFAIGWKGQHHLEPSHRRVVTTKPSGFCRSDPTLPRNTFGAMPIEQVRLRR